ncbi:hypothetical protein ACIQYS_01520 [Psychrobacillus sp. NPDC096426]|uniref:hypothetical protein n=1 Tax=Psychrobacillus sp. NPDC096426 TaxID=3364491 RepID=UPI0037F8AF27
MKFNVSTIIAILAVVVLLVVFGVEYYSYSQEQKAFDEEVEKDLDRLKEYNTIIENAEVEKSNSIPTSTKQPIVLTSYEPKIGMTAQQVYDSSWGYPNDQTKSTTASGTTEMWVYPENNYIHFKDGKVVSINESN